MSHSAVSTRIVVIETFLRQADQARQERLYNKASEYSDEALDLLLSNEVYASAYAAILGGRKLLVKTGSELEDQLRIHARVCAFQAVNECDQGRFAQAEDYAHRSINFSIAGNYESPEALSTLADIHRQQGRYEEADDELLHAIDLFQKQGKPKRAAKALDNFAHLCAAQGHLQEALERRTEALTIAKSLREPYPIAIFTAGLGKDHYHLGNLTEAEHFVREALRGLQGQDGRCTSYAFSDLGHILTARGRTAKAREAFVEAAHTSNGHCHAMAQVGLGWWELRFGSLERASDAFVAVVLPEIPQDDAGLKTCAFAGLALSNWKAGQFDDAQQQMFASRTHPSAGKNPQVQGFVLASYASLLRLQGNTKGFLDQSARSDAAFSTSVRPLVGLSASLSERLASLK